MALKKWQALRWKRLARSAKFNISIATSTRAVDGMNVLLKIYDKFTAHLHKPTWTDQPATLSTLGHDEVERAPIQAPFDARSRHRSEIDLLPAIRWNSWRSRSSCRFLCKFPAQLKPSSLHQMPGNVWFGRTWKRIRVGRCVSASHAGARRLTHKFSGFFRAIRWKKLSRGDYPR